MKNFRGLRAVILALTAGLSMLSCSSENEYAPNDDEKDFYTVQLGMGGEWDVSYAPLSRATTNDLYGVQVYSTPDIELEEGETTTWTKYAYGLFDDPDALSINLLKGYKYKFVATIVVDGKEKLYYYSPDAVSPEKHGYFEPFRRWVNDATDIMSSFTYSGEFYLAALFEGYSRTKDGPYDRPNYDRYYGELENYIPSAENPSMTIPMKRTSFGAKFIAKGKAINNGTVEISITGAPIMNLTPTDETNYIFDIFTFKNVKSAWASTTQYSETIPVTINWCRTDGTTVPLGTHDITFKRNTTTVVNVEVVNDASDTGIGFEITETGDMTEDENVTNIVDGEIVETEIEQQ